MKELLMGATKSQTWAEAPVHTNPGEELRAWTIRNVDGEVIRKSREAARQRGMKMGAWVAAQLRQAAERELQIGGGRGSEVGISELRSMVESIAASQIEEAERTKHIENEVSDMLKAQHGILTHLIQGMQK